MVLRELPASCLSFWIMSIYKASFRLILARSVYTHVLFICILLSSYRAQLAPRKGCAKTTLSPLKCHAACTHSGETATCKDRISWAQQHVFQSRENACALSYSQAIQDVASISFTSTGAGGVQHLPGLQHSGGVISSDIFSSSLSLLHNRIILCRLYQFTMFSPLHSDAPIGSWLQCERGHFGCLRLQCRLEQFLPPLARFGSPIAPQC